MSKGPSINVNIFMSVQTIHFLGGVVCENQNCLCTLLTFWPDFYYIFMGIFGTQKVFMCTLSFGGGGLRKCMVCTHKMLTFMNGP